MIYDYDKNTKRVDVVSVFESILNDAPPPPPLRQGVIHAVKKLIVTNL